MDENLMHRGLASLGSTLSRRSLGGLAAGMLLALGLESTDAKKKKKKKKKPAPTPNPTCTPKCSGKTCGSNGCGGSCGSCGQGSTCSAQGQCVANQAYEFVSEWGGEGSGNGQFTDPAGVAVDNAGNVYVVDGENNRVQKFSGNGAYITQWGSLGSGDGKFDSPTGIAIGGDGAIYVTDTRNRRVQKFRQNGPDPLKYDFVTKWGAEGEGDGQFRIPWGVAVDNDGNVYVTDPFFVNRVQKFRPNGSNALQYDFVTKWETDSDFVAVDHSGNVYLSNGASLSHAKIEKYSGTGTLLKSSEGDNSFGQVGGIALDSDDNVFAVDGNEAVVQKFDSQGNYVLTFADQRAPGYYVQSPEGIAVDADGNVYHRGLPDSTGC